jgi:hypothetical protein
MIDVIVEGLVLLVLKNIYTANTPGALESINKFLSDWIGLLVAVIGGILSIISFFYQRRRDKLHELSEAFKVLNDNTHREARRVVHTNLVTPAIKNLLGFDDDVTDSEVIRVCGDIVETDMEQIGTMARNKLFYEKPFLERYSSSIIMEWRKLAGDVQEQRKARQTPDYRQNFEYLNNTAIKYRKKKYGEQNPEGIMEYLIYEYLPSHPSQD